ncbi:MAG: hypothetical protein VZQ75_05625 [Candidatus Faecousia sp.]|nr:hypothetical protein [Candidatus Faecousia sp.]
MKTVVSSKVRQGMVSVAAAAGRQKKTSERTSNRARSLRFIWKCLFSETWFWAFRRQDACILPVLPFYHIKVINLQKSDKEIQIHKIFTIILLTSKDAGRPLRSGEAGVFV